MRVWLYVLRFYHRLPIVAILVFSLSRHLLKKFQVIFLYTFTLQKLWQNDLLVPVLKVLAITQSWRMLSFMNWLALFFLTRLVNLNLGSNIIPRYLTGYIQHIYCPVVFNLCTCPFICNLSFYFVWSSVSNCSKKFNENQSREWGVINLINGSTNNIILIYVKQKSQKA